MLASEFGDGKPIRAAGAYAGTIGADRRDFRPEAFAVRLKLTLEYDGTAFRGWARQPGLRTVEGVVREALDAVFPRWDDLAVAGRTDTGVHATGQVASVDAEGGPPS